MARRNPVLPLLLILVLLGAAVLAWRGGLDWTMLASRQADLRRAVAMHPLLAAALYLLVYAALVAVSFPGAIWITIAGGMLFGAVAGAGLALVGATAGATLLFLAARGALRPWLAGRLAAWLDRMRPRLQRDGFLYLLTVRLIPPIPFWMVNLAAALSGMRLDHFIAATFFGMAPITAVVASIGSGVGDLLAQGAAPDIGAVFSPPILLPLLALALLSLSPLLWRRWKARNGGV